MCSRFTLKTNMAAILKLLGIEQAIEWKPSYNVAPSQKIPLAFVNEKSKQREMKLSSWGLRLGERLVVNAQSETVFEKPSFKEPIQKGRCLIPVDGFYEWRHEGRETKPYFIRLKDQQPFALGGFWAAPQGQASESCVILTTEPNHTVGAIHNRMPVILSPADFEQWLDGEQKAESLRSLFKSYSDDLMEAYEISDWVNSPSHNDARCMEPFTNPGTLSLF
jgi:putative SOS response-associated peptidase YedK